MLVIRAKRYNFALELRKMIAKLIIKYKYSY